jgi:hypothetical protein
MLTSHLERVGRADPAPAPARPDAAESSGRVAVGAFERRAQAQRAIKALRMAGCAADQIELDGPGEGGPDSRWRRATSGWPAGPGAMVGSALLGAAVCRLAGPSHRGWLRGALSAPALGLSALAAITALVNPDGIEVFPWRVTVRSADERLNAGGVLRAHGARGVHVRWAEPVRRP